MISGFVIAESPMQLSATDLQRFLDIATVAALAGGSILQQYWGKLRDIQGKGRWGDLVTEADIASEQAILAVMQRHLPDHPILAEESGLQQTQQDSPLLWAIDPLDGTTNYAHQYPFYAVSLGLLVAGVPQVGVVYLPFFNELFQAAQGLGATLNYQPITVSATPTLAESLLVTGFAYDRRETEDNNYREFCHFTHITQGVRRGGSAASDLAYVACGRLDGYWERGLSPWDLAAGAVLVQEAGGTVTAYDGSSMNLNSGRILATNGHLHGSLSQALMALQTQVPVIPALPNSPRD
jgi:myo-inositol-1(or 4)-monophosphatase